MSVTQTHKTGAECESKPFQDPLLFRWTGREGLLKTVQSTLEAWGRCPLGEDRVLSLSFVHTLFSFFLESHPSINTVKMSHFYDLRVREFYADSGKCRSIPFYNGKEQMWVIQSLKGYVTNSDISDIIRWNGNERRLFFHVSPNKYVEINSEWEVLSSLTSQEIRAQYPDFPRLGKRVKVYIQLWSLCDSCMDPMALGASFHEQKSYFWDCAEETHIPIGGLNVEISRKKMDELIYTGGAFILKAMRDHPGKETNTRELLKDVDLKKFDKTIKILD